MRYRFTKMQGCGNDYVYMDCFTQAVRDPSELARQMSDRHFGVGSDGLILVCPPTDSGADFRMRMFNADGCDALPFSHVGAGLLRATRQLSRHLRAAND